MEYKTERAYAAGTDGPAWYGLWRQGADDQWHRASSQYGAILYTTEAHALAGAKVCAEDWAKYRNPPGGLILNNEKEADEARLRRAWDRASSSAD
jgi:hypothetical protein